MEALLAELLTVVLEDVPDVALDVAPEYLKLIQVLSPALALTSGPVI